jgi:hypothetical protein
MIERPAGGNCNILSHAMAAMGCEMLTFSDHGAVAVRMVNGSPERIRQSRYLFERPAHSFQVAAGAPRPGSEPPGWGWLIRSS